MSAIYALIETPLHVISLTSTLEGNNKVQITCNVDGIASPTITWFKDSMMIMSQSPQLIINTTNNNSSIVSISPATLANNGAYTCVASNDVDSVNNTIFIDCKLT